MPMRNLGKTGYRVGIFSLGGQAAIVKLVDAFYFAIDTQPEAATIRAMHDADLTHTKAVLVKYFSEWLGGPKLFSPERGAPMMVAAARAA